MWSSDAETPQTTVFYKEKYGTELWGLNKLYLMMEKEHNRGQEGAGIGCVKMEAKPGCEYIFRERSEGSDAISRIFSSVHNQINSSVAEGEPLDRLPFVGEVYMGHLRYSTTGRSGLNHVHPFMRRNNWRARNMLLCGNFNLTNVDAILKKSPTWVSIRAIMPTVLSFLSRLAMPWTARMNVSMS